MTLHAAETSPSDDVSEKYVARLRARLSRPKISVADARDGMLDCYVSTYHTGVKHGLKGILGVDASADQVAEVASKMFRDRLDKRGVSFDAPTVAALNEIKDELDEEFHFSELPVEVSATHDQVCSLLLAKADGLIPHNGDRSVVAPSSARPSPATRTTESAAAAPSPPRQSTVTQSLRQALAAYLQDIVAASADASPQDLLRRIDRARTLAQSIADFDENA